MRYLAIISLALLLISCSEDAPNEPAPAAPSVVIEVVTTAPEVGQPVEFKATVTGATLTAPVYEWDFGDDSTGSSVETASHTYAVSGKYSVTLRVSNNDGSVVLRDSVDVIINAANASLDLVVPSVLEAWLPLEFSGTVSGATLIAPVYYWDFGDGVLDTTTSVAKAVHSYQSTGPYTVRLRVVDVQALLDLRDSAAITLDNTPFVPMWNTIEITIGENLECYKYSIFNPDTNQRATYTRFSYTASIAPEYWSAQTVNKYIENGDPRNGYKYIVDGQLSPNCNSILRLDIKYYVLDSKYLLLDGYEVSNISRITPVTADSCVYRIEGIDAFKCVQRAEKWDNDVFWYIPQPNPDMYLEVRFYKK